MGKVVVRYKVKPGRVEENERLIGRVYAGSPRALPRAFATRRSASTMA
jgi:hypothetical protein